MLAAGCGAAVSHPPNTPPPAAAVLEPSTTEMAPGNLDPAVTDALGRYERALKKLSSPYLERREAALPDAVARLADAIAALPNGAPHVAIEPDVAGVQLRQVQMVGAPPTVSHAAAALALADAARALQRLAAGPYAGQPAVRARVDRFMETAERAANGESLSTDTLVRAMREADDALRAMYAVAVAESRG